MSEPVETPPERFTRLYLAAKALAASLGDDAFVEETRRTKIDGVWYASGWQVILHVPPYGDHFEVKAVFE